MRREMKQLSALVERGAFGAKAPDFPQDRIVVQAILPPSSRNFAPPAVLVAGMAIAWWGLGGPIGAGAAALSWIVAGERFMTPSWGRCRRRAELEMTAAIVRFAGVRLAEFEGSIERSGQITYSTSGIALEAGPVLYLVQRGTVARIPLSLLRGWRAEADALLVQADGQSWRIPLADPARWAGRLVDRCGPRALG